MPPRPTLPADDLYARLEISVDASPEAIEVAWRSLLRQHHPDVAGPYGLERAKRINVAHDWLSDPELRSRYDHERGLRRSVRDTGGRDPRETDDIVRRPARPVTQPRHGRPIRPRRIARFLDQVADARARRDRPAGLRGAATDRLRRDDRPLPAARSRLAALEAMEAAVAARLDPAAAALPGVRDAVEGYATELVLGTSSTTC